MSIHFKKKSPKTKNYPVPLSDEMKQELRLLQDEQIVDVNEEARRFFKRLLKKYKTAS